MLGESVSRIDLLFLGFGRRVCFVRGGLCIDMGYCVGVEGR